MNLEEIKRWAEEQLGVGEVPKFRYLFINENYELEGMNDSVFAHWMAQHGPVVDVIDAIYLESSRPVEELNDEWKQAWEDDKFDTGAPDNDDI